MAGASNTPGVLFFALLAPGAQSGVLAGTNGGKQRAALLAWPRPAFVKVGTHPCVVHACGAIHADTPLGLQRLPHRKGLGVFWPQPKRLAIAMQRTCGHQTENGKRLVGGLCDITGICMGCFKLPEGQQPCGCG